MITTRKERAKSKPKKGNGVAPWKAPKKNFFSTLMETPEGRELRRQWSTKPRKNAGRPKGVPDGYRKHEIEPIRAKAQKEAEEVVRIMSEKYNIEDKYAQEALQTAVEIMRVPATHTVVYGHDPHTSGKGVTITTPTRGV